MNKQKQLLLSDAQKISFIRKANKILVSEIPHWLCKYLGLSHGNIIGSDFEGFKNLFDDDIKEFLERSIFYKKSVKGFKASLTDLVGKKHFLLFDSQIFKDHPKGLVGNIFIQEIPAQNSKPSQLSNKVFLGLVGMSNGMEKVFNKIRMYSKSEAPVLVSGETGSGKEGVASAIHRESNRSNGPFITMNCSAITDTLFESELFGHEKGAFTGAIKSHVGRFERANNGTLFLDEIGDLPLLSQAKLLRVLETSEIEKVGSEKNVKVNVRIVAATNKNLELESANDNFRLDLFYRINALQIHVPPLRERNDDIELLIQHFINKLNEKYNRNVKGLTNDAILLLKKYSWPGNIRELRNLLERLFAENQNNVIGLESLREWYSERVRAAKRRLRQPETTHEENLSSIPLGMPSPSKIGKINGLESPEDANLIIDATDYRILDKKDSYSKSDIKQAYKKAGGNITKASALLGIHKSTFYRTLKNMNLSRNDLEN